MPKTARQLLDESVEEKEFHKQVVTLARMLGWYVWHDTATNAPRKCRNCGELLKLPRNAAGLPDLILIRDRVIWAELKRQYESPRPSQDEMQDRLQSAGQEVYLWWPSDWSSGAIEEVLRRGR